LDYQPNAVGSLSQFFPQAGQAVPSTLLMPAKTWVFYLSDEIFALAQPVLVTIDAHSTTILNIELAADRSAETWRAHFATLEQHHFVSLGMASDRGTGLVAGLWSAIIVSSRCEKVSSLRRQGCMTHTALDITPQSRHN